MMVRIATVLIIIIIFGVRLNGIPLKVQHADSLTVWMDLSTSGTCSCLATVLRLQVNKLLRMHSN